MDEQMNNVFPLQDENGNDVFFELMDYIAYEGNDYAVMLPVDDPEDEGGVVILRVEPLDEDTDNFLGVKDEAILDAVFALFQERNPVVFEEAEEE